MKMSEDQKIARLKLRWTDVIKKYTKENGVKREEARD